MYTSFDYSKFNTFLAKKQLDKLTIKKIIANINQFLTLYNSNLSEISFLNYRDYLKNSTYNLSTINNKLTALNHLISFLNYDFRLKSFKVTKNIHDFISTYEFNRLIKFSDNIKYYKYNLIIKVFAYSGIRINELHQILFNDLFKNYPSSKVTNKGKTRTIYLKSSLVKELKNYCSINNISSGKIFKTKNNKMIPHAFINRKLKEIASISKVKKNKVFAKNLRVYFANIHYQKHKNIYQLAEILGHESIDTTTKYLRGDLLKVYKSIDNL